MKMSPSYLTIAMAALITVFAFKASAEPRFEDHRHHRGHAECGEITLGEHGLHFESRNHCGHQGRERDADADGWGADAVLFDHSDFRGAALPLRGNIRDLAAMDFDDRASSIRIRRGVWQGCTEPGFQGRCWTVTDDDSRFSEPANNRIRSVRRVR